LSVDKEKNMTNYLGITLVNITHGSKRGGYVQVQDENMFLSLACFIFHVFDRLSKTHAVSFFSKLITKEIKVKKKKKQLLTRRTQSGFERRC